MAITISKSSDASPATKRLLEEMSASFPELLREQSDLMRRLNDVNGKVAAHTSMFHAYGIEIPTQAPATQVALDLGKGGGAAVPASGRAHRGKIAGHILEALKNGPMKTPELREEIIKRFGIRYGVSSLYRVLKLPENVSLMKVINGRWELR